MKKQVIRFVSAAALTVGLVLAQGPARRPGRAMGMGAPGINGPVGQRVMRALNLTDAQKEQAKTIFEQARQDAKPLNDQLKQNAQALADAVKANDLGQIQSLSMQQGNLRGQLLTIRSQAAAKFYNLLTPEQKQRADQARQRVRERLEQRRSRTNG